VVSLQQEEIVLPEKGQVVRRERLNLLTETGLRSLDLEKLSQVRLQDEKLAKELHDQLADLAGALDDERRTVQLRFSGNAAREVRAGYLQETPIWKTSYRLVLNQARAPYLQGWALVDNTSDEDWTNVRLSLVAGRPISFLQDLYHPLYVPRPVVAAQLVGSPTPQTYGDRLEKAADTDRAEAGGGALGSMAGGLGGGFAGGGFSGPGPAGRLGAPAPRGGVPSEQQMREVLRIPLNQSLALSLGTSVSGVIAQAAGDQRGDLFEYAISQPITLPKGRAAMVPIVTTDVKGEKLTLFDAATDRTHALHGFRLRNSTGLHLAGGPITVFQEGVYAGDAQIQQTQPDEERLLSYGVDADIVVGMAPPKYQTTSTVGVVQRGVLILTTKQHQTTVYTFRNKGKEPRTLLLQHPLDTAQKLVEPDKATERTADRYRFQLPVPAATTVNFPVKTERTVASNLTLRDLDVTLLVAHSRNGSLSQPLRAALQDLIARRKRVSDLQTGRAARENEIKTIGEEQARIRLNMERLDRQSALYAQYVKKLTEQEARIEQLRSQIATLRMEEEEATREMQEHLERLTVS